MLDRLAGANYNERWLDDANHFFGPGVSVH